MSQLLITEISNLVRIGAGAFGEVHSASHPIHGRIAVKRIQKVAGESAAEWLSRWQGLIGEGQRLKTAEHDRVVRVLDVSYSGTDDAVFLAMELCSESLQSTFEKGPMGIRALRDVLRDVTLGLQAVHNRGLQRFPFTLSHC